MDFGCLFSFFTNSTFSFLFRFMILFMMFVCCFLYFPIFDPLCGFWFVVFMTSRVFKMFLLDSQYLVGMVIADIMYIR